MRRPHLRLSVRRTCIVLCALSLWVTLWLGHPLKRTMPVAQAVDAQHLVQTGVDYYQAGNFLAALEPWQTAYQAYKASQDLHALAIVSENLARAHQQMGRTSDEISYWDEAIATIQTLGQTLGNSQKLGRLLTEQAQAYGRLGQHRRAITLLCGTAPEEGDCKTGSALQLAQALNDPLGEITALGSLGEAYLASGQTDVAIAYLQQGYTRSQQQETPELQASLLNSLGNTSTHIALINYRRAGEAAARNASDKEALSAKAAASNRQAIDYFQKSYDLAVAQQIPMTQLYALLNLIPAHERAENKAAAQQDYQLALDVLQQLPDSKTKAFAAIKLASFLEPLEVRQSPLLLGTTPPTSINQAQLLLEQALAIGNATDNPRITSFALGKLGNLDERSGRYHAALKKTQQARLAADQDRAAQDSLYLWEWQLGRIYKAQGKVADAGQAYGQAVALLEQIRSDILSANRDLQFDFRDTVEPIYRQYADLNLAAVPKQIALTQETEKQAFKDLETVLTTLDSLKVAELQSYFANDCVIVPAQTRADEVGQSTATGVFSTALSDDGVTVILSLPDGSRKVVRVRETQTRIQTKINDFRKSLEFGSRDYRFNKQQAIQLYQLLIQPFETDLAGVKTLVFVNDGLLRSVPMAALHDGQQFLIEKYAVATTPSLTLTTPEKVEKTELSALLLGVSKQPELSQGRSFGALPAVERELDLLSAQFSNSKTLRNEAFSIEALQQSLVDKDYRILHMATHGTFGFASEDNYLVAGAKDSSNTYNETLTISKLDELIRNVNDPTREPIELLTLTACETAIGGNRSTLGLAGVAVRAGVRSAIATLWPVSDDSTPDIINTFYTKLQDPTLTKAEALQQAQITMLQSEDVTRQHPYRWAPFILIGNWL
ncbi:CHAT domain-containing protein [Leptothoe spongobia]|uniref:CHAT domain-containing protein n=1 Tax=Leptothoe spongobia TAU-MAC 1115 TaxID=1967444 RepID=A0A947GKM6_9CYAN|nr:CHAT domain-containing protein [Leptothoe spongobia]MBT9317589.1 CHAT domain-containing protein [Leptothoe spongobia TAU-MAC 1115]